MNQPPEISTAGLRLVPPAADFAADIFDYSRDREFCRYIDAPPPRSIAESSAFLESLIHDNAIGRRCYWVVVERASGRAVGTLGLLFLADEPDYACQVGYGIARPHWGSGIFQEALALALDHGFAMDNVDRIYVLTRRENVRAARSVEKLGFERFRTIRAYYQVDNGDAVALCLARDRWKARRGAVAPTFIA